MRLVKQRWDGLWRALSHKIWMGRDFPVRAVSGNGLDPGGAECVVAVHDGQANATFSAIAGTSCRGARLTRLCRRRLRARPGFADAGLKKLPGARMCGP